jgi:hypothetical protein
MGSGLLVTNKRQLSFPNANHFQEQRQITQSVTILASKEVIRIPNKASDLGIGNSFTNAI